MEIKDVHFGLHDKNPVSRMRFFRKHLDLQRVAFKDADALVKVRIIHHIHSPLLSPLPLLSPFLTLHIMVRLHTTSNTLQTK